MRFCKYHALGNDYLVVDDDPGISSPFVIAVCDRHYGVGGDGLLVAGTVDNTTFCLRVFNPDGHEAEISGNGLRILARYLWDERRVVSQRFEIATSTRNASCSIVDEGRSVEVDMGNASFLAAEIPVSGCQGEVVAHPLVVGGRQFPVTCVNVGNPHGVVVTDDAESLVHSYGPLIESHAMFPSRANVQFMRAIDVHHIQIEIWERGAGHTLSSGSSSCAAAAAAVKLGLCRSPVTVLMPGGAIDVVVSNDYRLKMVGTVTKVAEGQLSAEWLAGVTG